MTDAQSNASGDSLFSVADRVTLVSGGSRGIGRELARGFAERGAKVVITGRDLQSLEQTAAEISTVAVATPPSPSVAATVIVPTGRSPTS